MVFRRDNKVDAFQRQISALRHQLGGDGSAGAVEMDREDMRLDELIRPSGLPDLTYGETEPSFVPASERSLVSREPEGSLPPVPAFDAQTSVISHGTSWNGNLSSSGSVHVHGKVDGSIDAREDIFVAEGAEVDAVLTAANVTVAGLVRGSILSSNRFEVLPRGQVVGDIRSPVIVVHEGAAIAGDVTMGAPSDTRSTAMAAIGQRAARGGD